MKKSIIGGFVAVGLAIGIGALLIAAPIAVTAAQSPSQAQAGEPHVKAVPLKTKVELKTSAGVRQGLDITVEKYLPKTHWTDQMVPAGKKIVAIKVRVTNTTEKNYVINLDFELENGSKTASSTLAGDMANCPALKVGLRPMLKPHQTVIGCIGYTVPKNASYKTVAFKEFLYGVLARWTLE